MLPLARAMAGAGIRAALLDTDTTVPDGDGDQVEVLGDSAYGTGDALRIAAPEGARHVIHISPCYGTV